MCVKFIEQKEEPKVDETKRMLNQKKTQTLLLLLLGFNSLQKLMVKPKPGQKIRAKLRLVILQKCQRHLLKKSRSLPSSLWNQ